MNSQLNKIEIGDINKYFATMGSDCSFNIEMEDYYKLNQCGLKSKI